MDPATLTAAAIAALTTFFSGAADGAAHKLGEVAVEQGKHIYEAIKARFHKEPDGGQASQMLVLSESNPKLLPAVKTELERIVLADPTFAQQLRQMLQAGPRQWIEMGDDAEGDVEQINRARMGTQEVHGGDRSTVRAKQHIE